MTRLTRRQFLGTAAGTPRAVRAPARLGPPAWAQQKQISDPVPGATSSRPTTSGSTSGPRSGRQERLKVTIDHVPHLQIPAKIAAEVATQSGHDIVQLVGSGTEKLARRADRRPGPRRQARQEVRRLDAAGRELLRGQGGSFHSHPRLTSSTSPACTARICGPRSACRTARIPGRSCTQGGMKLKAKGFPIGIGLAHHDDSRARGGRSCGRYGASEVAKDGKTITYNSKEMREALKFIKALYKDADDARGPRLGRRVQQPPAGLRARLVDPQPDQRLPHASRGRTRSSRTRSSSSSRRRGPAGRLSFANCRAYGITKFSKNQDAAKAVPGGSDRQLPGRRSRRQHRLQHARS